MTDCARFSFRPAAEKLPVSATANRTWSWSRVGFGCININFIDARHPNYTSFFYVWVTTYSPRQSTQRGNHHVHPSHHFEPTRVQFPFDQDRDRVRPSTQGG